MNILEAIEDPALFAPFIAEDGDDSSWRRWKSLLKALYGLPTTKADRKTIRKATGRKRVKKLANGEGFREALLLCGRRSGKSRMSAVIGGFEALFAGHEQRLSKGETGVVPIIAPTKSQGRIVHRYLRGLFETPMLANEVVAENKNSFELRNGVLIEILAGDFKTVRGFTLLACVVDEIAFFGTEAESKVKSDTELVRALRPALQTTRGKLIAIGTPYARRGYAYRTWKKDYANDKGRALVVNCPSRYLNPTLSQQDIDHALEEDLAAARSEYFAEFRDDIAAFLPREVIERLVARGRVELPRKHGLTYTAFVDVSGGRSDAAALAITHRDPQTKRVVLDCVRHYPAPHVPHDVVKAMVDVLREYKIRRVTGDAYSAAWVEQTFKRLGVSYAKSKLSKSQIYLELLPQLCSGEVELLDSELLVSQLAGLERRTRSGGRDTVDHAPGAHDDLANAVAGAVCSVTGKRKGVFAFGEGSDGERDLVMSRIALARLAQQDRIGSWDRTHW